MHAVEELNTEDYDDTGKVEVVSIGRSNRGIILCSSHAATLTLVLDS
jgi:hypothetical protein